MCLFCPTEPTMNNVEQLHQRRNALMMRLEAKGIATRQGTHAPVIWGTTQSKYGLHPAQASQRRYTWRPLEPPAPPLCTNDRGGTGEVCGACGGVRCIGSLLIILGGSHHQDPVAGTSPGGRSSREYWVPARCTVLRARRMRSRMAFRVLVLTEDRDQKQTEQSFVTNGTSKSTYDSPQSHATAPPNGYSSGMVFAA